MYASSDEASGSLLGHSQKRPPLFDLWLAHPGGVLAASPQLASDCILLAARSWISHLFGPIRDPVRGLLLSKSALRLF